MLRTSKVLAYRCEPKGQEDVCNELCRVVAIRTSVNDSCKGLPFLWLVWQCPHCMQLNSVPHFQHYLVRARDKGEFIPWEEEVIIRPHFITAARPSLFLADPSRWRASRNVAAGWVILGKEKEGERVRWRKGGGSRARQYGVEEGRE